MLNSNDNNQINSYTNFKIIIADTELTTFSELSKLNDDFCFINLSSDFAVNFVIEYEKVDYLLISNRIKNLDMIISKANKKKIKIFIIGKDIEYPVKCSFVKDFLIKEIIKNDVDKENNSFKKIFKSFFIANSKKRHRDIVLKDIKIQKSKIFPPKKPLKKLNLSPSGVKAEINEKPEKEGIKENKQNLNSAHDTVANKSSINFFKPEINNRKINNNTLDIGNPEIKDRKQNNNNLQNNSLNKEIKTEYQIKTIKQKVIAVIKAKGGVGSTTISIFFATLFKDLKTLIIDLNFNEGGSDIGYYFDIPKTPNLMVFTEGFDRKSFSGSIINIFGNLDVIQSPPTFMQSKTIDLKDIYNLADIARKKYDLIIFDLPNNINEFYLGVVDLADLLVMVSDCTSGSIGRLLNINSKYICNEPGKILIINKYNNSNRLKISVESLKDYFNIENITTIRDMDILNSKSDFKNFEFNNYENFQELKYIATEILTK